MQARYLPSQAEFCLLRITLPALAKLKAKRKCFARQSPRALGANGLALDAQIELE